MAFFPKQAGTTETSFKIGVGHGKHSQTIDATGLTADRVWYLPNANGNSGDALTTDGFGYLSWTAISGGGGSPNLDGGTASAIYTGGPLINGGGA